MGQGFESRHTSWVFGAGTLYVELLPSFLLSFSVFQHSGTATLEEPPVVEGFEPAKRQAHLRIRPTHSGATPAGAASPTLDSSMMQLSVQLATAAANMATAFSTNSTPAHYGPVNNPPQVTPPRPQATDPVFNMQTHLLLRRSTHPVISPVFSRTRRRSLV